MEKARDQRCACGSTLRSISTWNVHLYRGGLAADELQHVEALGVGIGMDMDVVP